MMLIKCTSALRSAQKSSCSFPAHFVLTNAPQSRAARGFFSAASVRGDVLSSCSFDEQAEANEQALSFDEQAYKIKKDKIKDKIKEHDIKEDDKITNAQSADADHGRLTAPCAAAAAPVRALLPGNVRSFSGKAKQTQAPLSTLEAPLKHLEANQANQAVNVTVTVNGTGIVNVIDYSLLVQSALPGCGRSAQFAPFAQLPLRLCVRSCSHEKCARWRRIFTAAAKSGRCQRGEIALFGIYFAFKARKTFFRYPGSSGTRSCA